MSEERNLNQLPESAALWAPREPSPRMQAIREVIEESGLDKLPRQQRRAFCACIGIEVHKDGSVTFKNPRTFASVAKTMGITAQAVELYVELAARKLHEMCQKKLDD